MHPLVVWALDEGADPPIVFSNLCPLCFHRGMKHRKQTRNTFYPSEQDELPIT
jgi:hypothetical protein